MKKQPEHDSIVLYMRHLRTGTRARIHLAFRPPADIRVEFSFAHPLGVLPGFPEAHMPMFHAWVDHMMNGDTMQDPPVGWKVS
jgi:hypothetical protein